MKDEYAIITEAIQQCGPNLREGASLLVGWVVVAEWATPHGTRILGKLDSDATGSRLTTWAANGMLHEALHTAWPGVDGDDE